MSFQGWPEEALDFYEGLEADNSKTYWTAHKAVYEAMVLGPMTELLDELAPGSVSRRSSGPTVTSGSARTSRRTRPTSARSSATATSSSPPPASPRAAGCT